jgi:hypothetical protein
LSALRRKVGEMASSLGYNLEELRHPLPEFALRRWNGHNLQLGSFAGTDVWLVAWVGSLLFSLRHHKSQHTARESSVTASLTQLCAIRKCSATPAPLTTGTRLLRCAIPAVATPSINQCGFLESLVCLPPQRLHATTHRNVRRLKAFVLFISLSHIFFILPPLH